MPKRKPKIEQLESRCLLAADLISSNPIQWNYVSTTPQDPKSLFVADVDGDNRADVLRASFRDDTITWHQNDGMDGYTEHVISDNANGAYDVASADIDGDGDLDVVSASVIDDKIAWYENDGAQFVEHAITSIADGAITVHLTDVDGDDDMDVVGGSYWDDTVAWYENDGNESFTRHVIATDADGVYQVHAGDVDADGDQDLLSISDRDGELAWYENDGGSFEKHIIASEVNARFATFSEFDVGDIDGDGDIDLVHPQRVTVFVNDGNGDFSEQVSFSERRSDDIALGDFDGDGDLDIGQLRRSFTWFENTGRLEFTEHFVGDEVVPLGRITSVVAGALSSEERDELIFANDIGFIARLEAGHATTDPIGVHDTVHVRVSPADVDNDSDVDIVVIADGMLGIYANSGAGNYVFHSLFDVGAEAEVVTADFDGDENIDILVSNADQNVLYQGNGSLVFRPRSFSSDHVGLARMQTADMDNDGDIDIVGVENVGSQRNVILYENRQDEFIRIDLYGRFSYVRAIPADMDNDGDNDLLISSRGARQVLWLENQGRAPFTVTHVLDDVDGHAMPLDIDQDGDSDFVSANFITHLRTDIAIYTNDGAGNFTKLSFPNHSYIEEFWSADDIDDDGDVDLIATGRSQVILFESHGGQTWLERPIAFVFPPTPAFVQDVDGDGDGDVLYAASRVVSWIRNDSRIGDGDFDRDGHLVCGDADALFEQIAIGSHDARFDLTDDGLVNLDDLDAWLALAGQDRLPSKQPIPGGDANLDGVVNALDLNIVGRNWKQPMVGGWCDGDFDSNGEVDAADLSVLGKNWLVDVTASQQGVRRMPRAALLTEVMSEGLEYPYKIQLAIDKKNKKLYWADTEVSMTYICELGQQLADDVRFLNSRQSLVKPLKLERKPFVVEA